MKTGKVVTTWEKIEKVLEAQRVKIEEVYRNRETRLRAEHESELRKICSLHSNEIYEVNKERDAQLKDASNRRLKKYKEIVVSKEEAITGLYKENVDLRKTLKRYREAYEIYRGYRDRLISLAKEMGTTSEQLLLAAGHTHNFFGKMNNLAELLEREGVKIDKRVEEKMHINEGDQKDDVVLRLVEELPDNTDSQEKVV
jgi:hypothetical protein